MKSKLYFTIEIERSTSALPRVLQVLSRRGFLLEDLSTEILASGASKVSCVIFGPVHWEDSIPGLLSKLVDVRSVEMELEKVNG